MFLNFSKDWAHGGDRGWKVFQFGIINLKQLPPQGANIYSEYYKGFIIKFAVWFPFDRAY